MTTIESPVIIAPNQKASDDRFRFGPALAVSVTVAALGVRFFLFIRKYSVNIFFMDQWDYLRLFFNRQANVASLFFLEHAPHREGIGLLPNLLLYPLSHWNSRVDSFVIGGAIFAAMMIALRLKCRLYGPLSYSDVAIPLIFLTATQFETLVITPNPSHSGFPLLLIACYCLALVARNWLLRYALILSLNFLLIYTGFGIFMGVVTIGLFLFECYWSWRRFTSVPFLRPFTALLLAIVSLASFLFHYVFQPAANCFQLPHNNWLNYPQFMGLMLSGFVVPRPLKVSTEMIVLGAAILFLMLIVFIWHSLHLVKSPIPETHLVGAVLMAFSLLFAANTSIGRQCLGLEQALSSRYSTLLIPAFLALYFYFLSLPWHGTRNLVLASFVVLLVPVVVRTPREEAGGFSNAKRRWADCYVRTGDIRYCDESTSFKIYPAPESTQLQQKLDYLKEHHLNLFAHSK
jgi:hypothetical protein